MVTAETYRGKAGYSMRFDGMEAGINDNVRIERYCIARFKFCKCTCCGRTWHDRQQPWMPCSSVGTA